MKKKKYVNSFYHMMGNKEFADYMLAAYENNPDSNLHMDVEMCWWHNDRPELVFFLMALYELFQREHNTTLDCNFLKSHDLSTHCDCKMCTVLWRNIDNNHIKLKCKHCGMFHWIRKSSYDEFKNVYRKKQGKYNILDYCFHCGKVCKGLDERKKKNGNNK